MLVYLMQCAWTTPNNGENDRQKWWRALSMQGVGITVYQVIESRWKFDPWISFRDKLGMLCSWERLSAASDGNLAKRVSGH